jgi:hypothetical protein
MSKINKTLFNFDFEGKNIYCNINFEKEFVKNNFYGDPEKLIKSWKEDLSKLLNKNSLFNTSIYFFKYSKGKETYIIDIYEPNGNYVVFNDVLAVTGHENLVLVDLNTKEWTKVHTN